MTYNQPPSAPTRKMTYAAIGGAIASVGMGLWAVFSPDTYANVPPGMESGIGVLLALFFGYMTREAV